ncbi:hypothetical protein LSCM1_07440 [Leishmania martiniquensis]|uniref:Uncharacterized protein n=1 Tax=Leishmania martiniquensis TaxID=1580590 RepID=A0A836HNP0_9TRYP|nr:hypothetical protein LSCM1_07440 [Leishmania martiniquensis]
MPLMQPRYHHQPKPSPSPRVLGGSSSCNTKPLSLTALRHECVRDSNSGKSRCSAAVRASDGERAAEPDAVPQSIRLFPASASDAPVAMAVRNDACAPMTDHAAVFSNTTATPARASQTWESVTIGISTAAVSLESSSSAATSSYVSCSLRPFIRATTTPTEDDCFQSPQAAAATVAGAHLKRHVSCPCLSNNAIAPFHATYSPPPAMEHVDSADRCASAATTAAPLLSPQGSQLSLSKCTLQTSLPFQGRPAQVKGVIAPTNIYKAPLPLPAGTTTTTSAALAPHATDHDSRANSVQGSLSRMPSGASAFHTVAQQQSQLSLAPLRSVSERLDASPPHAPRTSSPSAAAATHTTTAAASSTPSGSSKVQPSPLRSSTSPAAAISRAASAVPSLRATVAASEALTERTHSTASVSIGARHGRVAPPPPFPSARRHVMRYGTPPPWPPGAVRARTGTTVDAVGYRECERDILWRVLVKFFAALLLPHVFLWYALPVLIPHVTQSAAPAAAVSPRFHLHALSRNHPDIALFALELLIAGLLCWGLVRLRQISNPKGSRELHNLYSGPHAYSTAFAASPSSNGAGPVSVQEDRAIDGRYTSQPPATAKKYANDAVLSSASTTMAGLHLSSLSRRPRLRPLRNPSAGGIGSELNSQGVPGSSSSNAKSSGLAHRILFHPLASLNLLPTESLVSPRCAVTTTIRAATSGSATPMRDLASASRCPSESGSSVRRFASHTGGGMVSDSAPGGGGGSSTTCTTTPSLSPHRFARLTTPAGQENPHGYGEAHVGGSPTGPVGGCGVVVAWPSAFDGEESRPPESLVRSCHNRAGCPAGSPASPMTPSACPYASAFSALSSTGHASLGLTGLGHRDGSLARGMSGAVSIPPSAVAPTEVAGAARTDSVLLSPTGAAAAVFTHSVSVGRGGHAPTMTYFGLGLGFLICSGLATWRFTLNFYFAFHSFRFGTNTALWLWLIPSSFLGTAAYAALLVGGYTLRRRALQQLQHASSPGGGRGEEGQEEAARRMAAAAAALRRLRWMAWCLAFVPYPQQDAAMFVDVPEPVIMRPDAAAPPTALVSGGRMCSIFAVEDPTPTLPVVSLTLMAAGLCDGGDEAADDEEFGAATSALLRQSEILGFDEDKGQEVAISDEARGPLRDVLRVMQEATEQSAPAAETPSGVGGLATAIPCGGFTGAHLRTPTSAAVADFTRNPCNPLLPQLPRQPSQGPPPPSAMPCLPATGRSTLAYRGNLSSFSHQSCWSLGRRLQRLLATAHLKATWRAWIQGALHQLHVPDFLMRLQRFYSLKQQRRAERQRRQHTRVAAPAERQLWAWQRCELLSLERLMVWTYLTMLFFFLQALWSLMYFTWSWRSIARSAATATMYATDMASTATPVPPSFAVYSCTKAQLHLRDMLWFIPPFCVGHGDSVSAPQPSTRWTMANQVALLFTLLGQRSFEMAYLYTNVALPIGFASSLYLFAHEVWLHLKSRRVLRLLALARSKVETTRKLRDAML